MIYKIDFKIYISILLLVYVLFMSNKTFDFYYIGIITIFCLFFLLTKIIFDKIYFYGILVFGSIFIFRSLIFSGTYDLKEYLKFICAFGIFHFTKIDINRFIKILLLYSFIDFFIGLLQFFKISFWGSELINSFYGASTFFELLNADNVRAYGLSSSSGNRGALLFLIFIILNNYNFKKNIFKYLFLFFISISLILAQSKTAFVLLLLYLFYQIFIFSKLLSVSILGLILLVALYFNVFDYLIYFNEYYDLLLNGINTSSVDGRFANWNYYFNGVTSNIITLIFGPGRDFFSLKGDLAPAFDSDYLYLVVNFGFLGVFFLFSALLISYSKNKIKKFLHYDILFFGFLCGLSINFFFDIKVLYLLMILFSRNSNMKIYFK
jgi:hypothetical protein